MKKYFYFLMMAVAGFAFIACEDVPEPYGINLITSSSQADVILSETFATSLGKFTSQTTDGEGAWAIDYSTAKAAGYDNNTKITTAGTYYLVSPKIDLTGIDAAHVTFDYILRYLRNAEDQRVLISSDYAGDAATATWTALPVKLVEGSDWSTFANADVDIPSEFLGKVVNIALYYSCGSSNSSTWEVKNLKVLKGKAGGDNPGPDPTVVMQLPYEESFATSFGNFVSKTISGSGEWVIDYSTAKATGYDNSSKKTTAGTYFLLSPTIDLTGITAAHVAYEYILRYNQGDDNQQVLISSDYVDDITAATWTVLKKKHTEGSDWKTFISEDITVPEAFLGKAVRVAFAYNTNAVSGSTWEVKNFSIKEGEGSEAADGSTYNGGQPQPQPTDDVINETFASSLGVFTNVSVVGNYAWHIDYSCAQITSYESSSQTNNEAEAYLVSAPVTLENEAYHVSFEYILRYALEAKVKENHQILLATNYTGDPATTSWTALDFTASQGSDWKTWFKADFDIPSAMQGQTIVVALRYVGTTEKAGTWEVRNFVLTKGTSGGNPDPGPTPEPGEGTGTGTLADPYNAVAATAVATALGSGKTSTESYYIKGKISEIKYTFDATHGTATFFISDDGTKTNQFQVYSTYYLGNRSWQEGDTQIQLNDEVIIYGQLTNYNGTPETAAKKSCLYSLNGVTDGGSTPGPTPDPGTGVSLDDFTNGDFEAWEGSTPTGWQTGNTAGNATLAQSDDAHSGSYSVRVTGTAAGNKRLGYQPMTLEAGSYTVTFYAKAATSEGGSVRPGYVPISNGQVGTYVWGDYENDLTNTEWRQVTYTFELSSTTLLNLVVMNAKNPGKDVLIDDYTIVKN